MTDGHFWNPVSSFASPVQDTEMQDKIPWRITWLQGWGTWNIKSWKNSVCLVLRRRGRLRRNFIVIAWNYREDGTRLFLEKHSDTKRGNGHELHNRVLQPTRRGSFQPKLLFNQHNLAVFRLFRRKTWQYQRNSVQRSHTYGKMDSDIIKMPNLYKLIQRSCFTLRKNPQNVSRF